MFIIALILGGNPFKYQSDVLLRRTHMTSIFGITPRILDIDITAINFKMQLFYSVMVLSLLTKTLLFM